MGKDGLTVLNERPLNAKTPPPLIISEVSPRVTVRLLLDYLVWFDGKDRKAASSP